MIQRVRAALLVQTLFLLCTFGCSTKKTFWGMTSNGGEYGYGTIFKTDNKGDSMTIEHSFVKVGPSPYGKLVEARNGKLYGMSNKGGKHRKGILFEYDPSTSTYRRRFSFGKGKGSSPRGSLLEASNGKLYGTTFRGGSNDGGVLFEYDPSSSDYTKKLDFDGEKGARPRGSLIEASNGKLYGITKNGGSNGNGVLFEYELSTSTYSKKVEFGGEKAWLPYGSLVEASNGKLYGTTRRGGINARGVLFEYDPSNSTYSEKINFGQKKGKKPYGSLVEAGNGKLYGTTFWGGRNDGGVLFEYDPSSSSYTKKIDFGAGKGSTPGGSLTKSANGKLYGTLRGGGKRNKGVLFEYVPSDTTYAKKLEFGEGKGMQPRWSLVEASNGKLYGINQGGGTSSAYSGVLFGYDPSSSSYTKELQFQSAWNGGWPQGSLMEASNGKLYGMTSSGGSNGGGVLFEYDASSSNYTKELDFDEKKGIRPQGSLIEASNEKLYGMTTGRDSNNTGTLFEYDPSNSTYSKKFDFGGKKGARPQGSLMEASNGKLYGMTFSGGSNGKGVLFEYDPSSSNYTKKLDFGGEEKGSEPRGTLMEASNGKLYGLTSQGGQNHQGVLFEYDPSNSSFTKLFDFDGRKGKTPLGSLVEANNGKLYGMTLGGGRANKGVLFEYDLDPSTCTKKIDFSNNKGSRPHGSLMKASNGKLYGFTRVGGSDKAGVLFRYDPSTSTYTSKLDFKRKKGFSPIGRLIEIAVR